MEVGVYRAGPYCVEGTNAEILSVILEGGIFRRTLDSAISNEEIVKVLDSRTPPEERAVPAMLLLGAMARSTSKIGSWIPVHQILPKYEFANKFYPGYRDHSIHSLLVYLTGWYLYEQCGSVRHALLSELRIRSKEAAELSDIELFSEWWTVAALWHDWGYLFETDAFITDAELRLRIFEELNIALGKEPFRGKLSELAKRELTEQELRQIYRAGRYYPLNIKSIENVIDNRAANEVVEKLFRRLGACPEPGTSVQALIALTSRMPPKRLPYYDHGLLGAMLLSQWWSEVEKFVTEFASSVQDDASSVISRNLRDDAALEVMSLDGILNLGVEAIAFHNIALRNWNDDDRSRFLQPGTMLKEPSLRTEAHLFFLSLCDTLQDWDRHHFSVDTTSYRLAVPSSKILIQAKNEGIYFSDLQKPEKQLADGVKRLFQGWLAKESIDVLLKDGASYSRKNIVFSKAAVTLAEVDQSYAARASTEKLLKEKLPVLKEKIITDPQKGIAAAGVSLEEILATAKRNQERMVPQDWRALQESAIWSEINTLQRMATAMIGVGTLVSQGCITHKLGEGGFGTVYGVHPMQEVNYNFAYKVYHATELSDTPKRQMFRRGFDAMQRIGNHAGVVAVHQYTEFPVGFYMTLIPGPNLEIGVSQIGTVFDKLKTLEQIADTLAYAHEREVYHRDVKPSNVILDSNRDLRPVLTDFDLAWISGRSTIVGAAYASMRYGAPEQFEDRLAPLRTRPTVDVFSFGALMYFVLSEREPPPMCILTREHEQQLREKLQGHLLAGVIDRIVELLKKCIDHDAEKRIPSMAVIGAAFRGWMQTSVNGQQQLSNSMFEREIVEAAGLVSKNGVIATHSQRVRVSVLVSRASDSAVNLVVTFELRGEASYNVVSHEAFRSAVDKRLTKILAKVQQAAGATVARHRTAGLNQWTIDVGGLTSTKEVAWKIGAGVRDVVQAIE